MQAKDIMNTNVATVVPGASIKEIAKLLADRQVSAVPVVDSENRVLGIVSEGDLIRRADQSTFKGPKAWWLAFVVSPEKGAKEYIRDHGTRAEDVMTRKVITVPEDATLHDIAVLTEKHRIKRVPVTRDGKLVGIVSRSNLLRGFVAESETQKATPKTDDASIRSHVLSGIREADPSITDFADVIVKNGVVYLWGGVRSETQAEAIRVAAQNVPGVWKIENRITVMPKIVLSTLWAE